MDPEFSSSLGTKSNGDDVKEGGESCTDLAISRPNRSVEKEKPATTIEQKTAELLQMANTTFIRDYMESKQKKDSNWRRYKEKTGKKSKLYLEASMFSQPPKALRIATGGGQGRKRLNGTVTRTVRLPPLTQNTGLSYQELCRGISIYSDSPTAGEPDILLLELKGEKLKEAFDTGDSGWITTDIQLPEFGTWNVYWFATLEDASAQTDAKLVNTPKSSPTHVLCETSRAFDARKRLPGLVTESKKVGGTLRSTCRQWENINDSVMITSSSTKLQDFEGRFSNLVRQVNKASDLAEKMYITLEDMGWRREEAFSRQKELNDLVRLVAEASMVKEMASGHVERSRKRQGMKSFKLLVADMIENKDLSSWIQSVQEKDIVASGGDLNRLYQMLMEGKAANSSSFERMSSLMSASKRNDLFSEKQCKALLEKAMEMDESLELMHPRALGSKSVQEAAAIQSEEILPLSAPVELSGLKLRSDLNGRKGNYVGLGENGRYNIDIDGTVYSLKLDNFLVTDPALKHLIDLSPKKKKNGDETWKDCAPKVVNANQKASVSSTSGSKKSDEASSEIDTVYRPKGKRPKGRNSSIKTFKEEIVWFPEDLKGRFIGTKAERIHALGTQTQTRMFVDATTKGEAGLVALRIEGPPNNIEIAKEHVRLFLEKEAEEKKKKMESKAAKSKSSVGQTQKKQPVPTARKLLKKKDQKKGIAPPPNRVQETATFAAAVSRSIVSSSAAKPTVEKGATQPTKVMPKVKRSPVTEKAVKPGASSEGTMTTEAGRPGKNVETVNRQVSEASLSPSEEILPNKEGAVEGKTSTAKDPAIDDSRVFTPITVPGSISVLTEQEEVSAVSQPIRVSPSSVTIEVPLHTPPGFKGKHSRIKGTVEDLLVFLQQNVACIKGSPEEFHQFLIESDVKSVPDLNDACKDKFFLPLMRNEWLKGFKVNSFIAAVADASDRPPVFKVSSFSAPSGSDQLPVPSSTLPDEFGVLKAPLTDEAAIAMQQLNFASNMGSDLPLASSETGSGDRTAGGNDSQLFWGNWN
ncbi:MAG: hypothetical protein SGILL_005214 [Bacillariaceae sp.]